MDEALEGVGIIKTGGLAVGCILMVVLLFGVMDVMSLSALAEAVGQDVALCAVLGIQALEQKMLYRTLAAIKVTQYQAWMSQVVRTLQEDPRTASVPGGVTAGDETQVSKRYGGKMPGIRVIFLHSEKIFTLGYDIVSTLYADWKKHYPLFFGIYQPDEAQQAKIAEAKERKKLKVDRRKSKDQSIAGTQRGATVDQSGRCGISDRFPGDSYLYPGTGDVGCGGTYGRRCTPVVRFARAR